MGMTGDTRTRRRRGRLFGALVLVSLAGGAALAMLWGQGLAVLPVPGLGPLRAPPSQAARDACTVRHADLRVWLTPGERLEAQAVLEVRRRRSDAREMALLLGRGYRVDTVTVNGARARHSRTGAWLRVDLRDVAPGAAEQPFRLTVRYAGAPADSPPAEGVAWSADACFLPPDAAWYPRDRGGFHTAEVRVEVPEGVTVVAPGDLTRDAGTARWTTDRPVAGLTLAAGRYAVHRQYHGDVTCALFVPDTLAPSWSGEDVERLLRLAGAAHARLTGLLGHDGFRELRLVLAAGARSGAAAADAVYVLPEQVLRDARDDAPQTFALLAERVAGNWWGGTVAGRASMSDPGGAAWLAHGFPAYFAALALEDEYGRDAALRHLEQVALPRTLDTRFDDIALADAASDPVRRDAARGLGLFMLRALETELGRDAVLSAARSLLEVLAYGPASSRAWRHELELAAETDLGELFDAWLLRAGVFDLSLDEWQQDGERVTLAIGNPGDFPPYGPVEVVIWTEAGMARHTVEPGAVGGAVTVESEHAVERVALDALLQFPDQRRGNNVLPRQSWPAGLAANGPAGALLWTSALDWPPSRDTALTWLRPEGDTLRRVLLDHPPAGGPAAGLGGFAWLTGGPVEGPAAYRWAAGTAPARLAGLPRGARLLGAAEDSVLLAGGPGQGATVLDGGGRAESVPGPPPDGHVAWDGRRIAWVDAAAGALVWRDGDHGEESRHRVHESVAGVPAWTADGQLRYVVDTGTVFQCDAATGETVSLHRIGLNRREHLFSPRATRIAWVDFAGRVHVRGLDDGAEGTATMPGELVDWAWMGEEALYALTCAAGRGVPPRYLGAYALWRLPAGGPAERLSVNPARR